MAKIKEQKTARILYVEQGKTQKEIAQLLGITEKTIGLWVKNGDWEKERASLNASPVERINNIKAIITNLSYERLELDTKAKQAEKEKNTDKATAFRERISKIDDAASKWNKTLENVSKENQVSLSNYLTVMESIFNDLRLFNVKLFMETVDFQEYHLHKITSELG